MIENLINESLISVSRMIEANLLATTSRIQVSGLLLGSLSILAGLSLMKAHKVLYDQTINAQSTDGLIRFEQKKMRRRTLVAALVTSIGCMLVALFWVNEVRVLAMFALMIMLQLIVILGLAMVDMFSVGVRTLTRIDERPQKEMIEEFLRQREISKHDQDQKDRE